MVKLLLGLSGSGKTKTMIKAINEAAKNETGSVVCVEMHDKLRFDINYNVRLIQYKDYNLTGERALKGFISGLHAGNFDITHIFLKSIHRLIDTDDIEKMADFCEWCEEFGKKNNVSFTMTATEDPDTAPARLKKYL